MHRLSTNRIRLATTLCLLITTGVGSAVPVGFRHTHAEGDAHHHHSHGRPSELDHQGRTASNHQHLHLGQPEKSRPHSHSHDSIAVPRGHFHISWGPFESTIPDRPSDAGDDSTVLLLLMDDISVLASRCVLNSVQDLTLPPPQPITVVKSLTADAYLAQDFDHRCDVARHARSGVQLF